MKKHRTLHIRKAAAIILLIASLVNLCAFSEDITDLADEPGCDTAEYLSPAEEQDGTIRLYVDKLLSGRAYNPDGIIRLAIEDICALIGLDSISVCSSESGEFSIKNSVLSLTYYPEGYIEVNNRYLYCPEGVLQYNGKTLFSADKISRIFNLSISVDEALTRVDISSGECSVIENGDTYYRNNFKPDDIYWLARIIYPECGNGSFEGMIGVGNVVLNRVADFRFPDDVHDVVFEDGQFEPVANGKIDQYPNERSEIAAYICLEGYNVVGDAIYFFENWVNVSYWLSNDRFICKIDGHKFYR